MSAHDRRTAAQRGAETRARQKWARQKWERQQDACECGECVECLHRRFGCYVCGNTGPECTPLRCQESEGRFVVEAVDVGEAFDDVSVAMDALAQESEDG